MNYQDKASSFKKTRLKKNRKNGNKKKKEKKKRRWWKEDQWSLDMVEEKTTKEGVVARNSSWGCEWEGIVYFKHN